MDEKQVLPSQLYLLKVTDLKEICRASGLIRGGNKQALTERISRAFVTGNLTCRNAVTRATMSSIPKPRGSSTMRAQLPPPLASSSTASTSAAPQTANSDTQCLCGSTEHTGLMICCDECAMWQHCVCVGIAGNALPEEYVCERCRARHLDPFLPAASDTACITGNAHLGSCLVPSALPHQLMQPFPANVTRLRFHVATAQLQNLVGPLPAMHIAIRSFLANAGGKRNHRWPLRSQLVMNGIPVCAGWAWNVTAGWRLLC